jgi:Co/Zn/Cd efflux system component
MYWLAATALLLVTTSAIAHEVEHDIGQHQDPACALHALADHAGNVLPTVATVLTAAPQATLTPDLPPFLLPRAAALSFRARAPPVSGG